MPFNHNYIHTTLTTIKYIILISVCFPKKMCLPASIYHHNLLEYDNMYFGRYQLFRGITNKWMQEHKLLTKTSGSRRFDRYPVTTNS
jgi:hypothetical protein